MVLVFLDSDKIWDVAGTYHGMCTWQAEDRSVEVQVLILLFFHILDSLAHPCGITCDNMAKLPSYPSMDLKVQYCKRALLFLLL